MHVTATAVLKWVKQHALENYEKTKPQTNTTATVKVDEKRQLFKKKKQSLDLESILPHYPDFLDWKCENRDSQTLKQTLNRLHRWNV